MNKVVHFEIPFEDINRAKKFYSIFGWQIQEYPEMDYICVQTVAVDENHKPKESGAINGGMMKRTDKVKSPVITINVDSVDEHTKKVIQAGGKVVMPKMEVHGIGYYAYVTDTEGNVIGLWENIM